MTPGQNELINKSEAAKILRLSTRTLDRLVSEGVIGKRQISKRRVCFQLTEILKHAGLEPVDTLSRS